MKSLFRHFPKSIFISGFTVFSLWCFILHANATVHGFRDGNHQEASARAVYQHRAANVALELQIYRHRLEGEKANAGTLMNTHTQAGITIRKDLRTASTIFYQDDMESGLNGWTGVGLWHQTTRNANTPTHSWWPGVELQGDYNTGARVNDALFSPAIDLTTALGSVSLLFTENYITESGWDFCMVDVAVDGSPIWNHLRGGYGESPSGDSYGWQVSALDLTPYAGHTINLRFVFDTGDSLFNDLPGWFVDNVVVFDQSGTIAGIVYYDQNQNGIRDNQEFGLPAWPVTFVGPVIVTVESGGAGSFRVPLPLGMYQVSETVQPLWLETSVPPASSINLTSPGQLASGTDFGNYRQGCLIHGMTFNDANHDSIFNAGELPNPNHEIRFLGPGHDDYVATDSSGAFTFFTLTAGQYLLQDMLGFNWFQTAPTPTYYTLNVPANDTVMNGFLFGSFWVFGGSEVRGSVFNDLNRDSLREFLEPGLSGWRVDATTPGTLTTSAVTDSAGNFVIDGLIAGSHMVSLQGAPLHWRASAHPGPYAVNLDSLGMADSLLFGAYLLRTGSVGGRVFNDKNENMIRDSGEAPLGHTQVILTGKSGIYIINASTVTDDTGYYRFGGLWAGTYQTRVPMTSHWRQTSPAFFQPQSVGLGDEQDLATLDFGYKYDSTFSFAYRTFFPESIAFAQDHKGKPGKSESPKAISSEATFDLIVPSDTVRGLLVSFSQSVDPATLTITHFTVSTHDAPAKVWQFSLADTDSLSDTEHVTIFARGNKGKLLTLKYSWIMGPLSKTRAVTAVGQGRTDYAMPNEINLLETMFFYGLGSPNILSVGLTPGPHSVYHQKASDVWKSLFDSHHHNVHLGPARCIGIDAKSLKPIAPKHDVRTLPPASGQNIMFAEALALKVNIAASDLGITPFGFGDLIFQGDSTNRYNGLHVREIAKSLDTSLSAFDPKRKIRVNGVNVYVGGDTCICDTNFFTAAYRTVRMIDSAFSGPVDTVSFVRGLIFTPVRTLADVPYLHIDSSFSQVGRTVASRLKGDAQIPARFALFQNYPNPFNPSTRISFVLPFASRVSLTIYNTLGQEVVALLNKEEMDEGGQEVVFNASSFASGVYFYRLAAEGIPDESGRSIGSFTAVKKMILLK